jgi:hypothetical protein
MIDAHQSSPWMTFIVLGSGSTVFTDEPSSVWKNTSRVVLFSWLQSLPTHQLRCSLPSQCDLRKTL